jgi:hypothetical protein
MKIRISELSRSLSTQTGSTVVAALHAVRAAAAELEIHTLLLSEKQAGEVERIAAATLRK